MRWAILTPERSVPLGRASRSRSAGAGSDRRHRPTPASSSWLTYYHRTSSIPARLKLQTMAREMPKRYWKNLPEAELIGPLASSAEDGA
jgi:DNA polymerase